MGIKRHRKIMTVLSSLSMYFLSFLPLWISVLFIDGLSIIRGNHFISTEIISISLIIIGILVASIIVYYSFLSRKTSNGAQSVDIENVEEEKTITAEYLLSYILPLFAFDFTVWHQVVLFLIFFITLGILCVKHNYLSVNITLEIIGYSFYKCRIKNEDSIVFEKTIISKENLLNRKYENLTLHPINNEYSLDITDWEKLK